MPEMQDRQIRRKEQIPEQVRTPDRDKAAKVIMDMWPATLNEIADEAGYSRQHIRNTIEHYFQLIDDPERMSPRSITIPEDVENEADFLLGYLRCKQEL